MKQKLLNSIRLRAMMLVAVMCAAFTGTAWADSETLTISSYASANKWSNSTQYTSATVGVVTFEADGGGNTGKYYSTDDTWRFYAGESATLTISVPSGYTLVSVVPTFTVKDNGTVSYGGNTKSSGSTVSVSGASAVFSIGSSSGSKGKVFFTSIAVTYTPPTHTLTYSATNGSIGGKVYNTETAVASGASVAEGGKVTLTAEPASGYSFTGWSVEGTGSTLSSTSTNPTTFTMGTANSTVTANFEVSTAVNDPTFTVPEGTYNEAQSVELNCTTDGATIYYTTDGSNPTTGSSVYSSAISVTRTTTIKAYAVKAGLTDSEIASATYTLKCATPTITVPAGAFLDSKVVTMSATDGATIHYTTNGDTPTSGSTAYDPANKPSISATTTFKAIAVKDGWSDSEVATATFTKIVPKTVGEALTAIAALAKNGTIADQYVSGIVSTTGSVSSGSVTYYISADGTTSSQLQVYKGKGIDGADFTNETNLDAGDEVVVFGTLKNYNGTTPEFDSGSVVIKRVTKETPTFLLDITEKTLDAYTKESVDVELTTDTDGELTCESDDEDVATVALKSGTVYTITAKTEGTATITIRSAASATYKPASATVAITVTDTRADAGISFTEDAEETTWGDSYTTQALTNTNSVAVTWSSTDEAVATVNASTGAITILKAGETDIKATFAGNATYKAAVASYTLTVNKAEAGISYSETSFDVELNDDSFVAPTLNNPNALEGITYASNNTTVATVNSSTGALSLTTSAEGTVKITATFAGNDNYKSGSANYTITVIDPTRKGSKLNPYTVADVEGQASATDFGNNIYVTGYIVGWVKDNKCYKTTADKLVNTNLLLADTPDISFTEGASVASNSDGLIPVELPSSPSSIRTNWGLASNAVIGYKVVLKGNAQSYFSTNAIKGTSEVSAKSIAINVGAAGYTTITTKYPTSFEGTGVTAYKATAVNPSTIHLEAIDEAPAGEALVIKASAGLHTDIPVIPSAADINDNILQSSTGSVTGDGSYIYALGVGKSGVNKGVVGFYLVNSGQTIPAGKAYLNTGGGLVKEFLTFDFDDATAIAKIQDSGSKIQDSEIFNLAGQKMSKLQKGVNIVNGKKVLVK